MKKLFLFLTIQLLFTVLCGSLLAQPQFYNFSSNGTNSSTPFNLPPGKDVQLLYLPGDLDQPIPVLAGDITAIYFRMGDTYPINGWTFSELTVKMGQSTITSFTPGSFYSGSLTTVYYRPSITMIVSGGSWLQLILDTPFPYDPNLSLIVDIGQCGAPSASGLSACFTNSTSNRRVWSTGGCPYTPFGGADDAEYHFGVDVSTISVECATDSIDPIVHCAPDFSVGTNNGCNATGIPLDTPLVIENCTLASLTNDAPAIFPLGSTIVTWTATDLFGNSGSGTITVTVLDDDDPTITCPADINTFTNTGCTATGVVLGAPVTADNCSIDTVFNNAPIAFPLGVTTVTWTIIDGSGNSATCEQVVTVSDNIDPTITCPPGLVVYTNTGCTATGVDLGNPTTNDNCNVAFITNDAPGIFPFGNTIVTWTATDDEGNTATCTQIVSVLDNVPPIIHCPPAIVVETDSGCTATGVALDMPFVTENCSIDTIYNDAPTAFQIGNTVVTWTVIDGSTNSATCTVMVTVIDDEDPIIICPADTVIGTNNGCTAINVILNTPLTADNCSVDTVFNNAPSIFPLGNTTVTWTVIDSSGNMASCVQLVSIVDTIPPIISCPINITVNTAPGACTTTGFSIGFPTYTDNCNGLLSVTNDAPIDYQIGPNYVTWTIIDGSGNISTCIQTVQVGSTPLAVDDSVTTPESTPVQIDVLANDVDCGNDLNPASVTIVTVPQNGTVVVDPVTGIITYTPDYLFVGLDQFDYEVCDLGNLCSVATVYVNVTPVNNPQLGMAKVVSKVEQQEDGSYNITYVITAQNLGNDTLINIQIKDDLAETFPLPTLFTMVSPPYTNSSLTPNATFDGSDDIELLDSAASYLFIGASATVEFTVNVAIWGYEEQTFCNYAVGVGTGYALGAVVSDTTDLGYITDSDGNAYAGDDGENDCTPITLVPLSVFIPDGFSPDGDGINDYFVIRGIEDFPKNKLTVFNRWGNIVFSMEGYKSDWDGKPNSNMVTLGDEVVPRGTYYYILELNKGDIKSANGYLIIQH